MTACEGQQIRHLWLIEDSQGRRVITLEANTYSIGRGSTNSIVIHSKRVSRQHAILLRVTVPETDSYLFRIIDGDLQGKRSTNGLIVNGQRCFAHNLEHGDIITFGGQAIARYFITASLSESEFLAYCEAADFSHLSGCPINPWETLVTSEAERQNLSEAAISRLASFPELSPHPILEINLAGHITYLNPVATQRFPELQQTGLQHPLLAGLLAAVQNCGSHFFVREVTLGAAVFEQSVHYLAESELIRCFLINITERKQAEAALRGVAEATHCLLSNPEYDSAIANALAILGAAVRVDRVSIYENHPHAGGEEMAASLRQQWCRDTTCPAAEFRWQNQPYNAYGLSRWYNLLAAGQSIGGPTREFPTEEQEILRRHQIQSTLMVPIIVENHFWGYIGIDDCHNERQWSKNDEFSLFTMAASISGALERQRTENLMRYQAFHDLLTGLPNRMLFQDRLEQAVANARRRGDSLAVMFLDLDRFKTINDTLGHTVGDQLLQCVTQRLTQCLRAGDTVARWGGDEFTLLLPMVNQRSEVAQTAARILAVLQQPFRLNGHELYITTSIGIAFYEVNSQDSETLIKHADAALYLAKEKGRNSYQFYSSEISVKTPEQLTLEKSLRYALEREEFVLYYQPQINIKTGAIIGMEALLRWHHPKMGMISPNVFLPIAEETGLIIPIGEWVLQTACIQNKFWQIAGLPPITIAVNLSARQFRQPNLKQLITEILAETELDPHYLELEITETTAIKDMEFTCTVLQSIRELGVRISMDDFGTGYSSLSSLKIFPLNTLKIDQSFVRDMVGSEKDAQIVTAVIALGRGLNLSVIAEGVENQEQLSFLRSLDCEGVQGFLFNRPLIAAQATQALSTWQFPVAM